MKNKSPDLLTKNTLISYLWATIRGTSLYAAADRTITIARRFLFLTRIFRYISIAFAIIETSAILILLAAFLIILVPILILALIILTIADFFIGRRILQSGAMADALASKKIVVIASAGNFGDGFASELRESGTAVFVITADIRRHFVSAKKYDGVWYIRHAFFFRLKRSCFAKTPERMIYLL